MDFVEVDNSSSNSLTQHKPYIFYPVSYKYTTYFIWDYYRNTEMLTRGRYL